MRFLDKVSLAFVRIVLLMLGIFSGYFWLIVLNDWSYLTWATGFELGALIVVPISGLVVGVCYLVILSLLIFRGREKLVLIQRFLVLLVILLVSGLYFLFASEKLFAIPFLRTTNAPLTVLDSASSLESELGFRPLLPTKSYPNAEAKRRRINPKEFGLIYFDGHSDLEISQAVEGTNSTFFAWCNKMQQDATNYSTIPVTVAGESAVIYFPSDPQPDSFLDYCVPLNDRVIYASYSSVGKPIDLDDFKLWLESLK